MSQNLISDKDTWDVIRLYFEDKNVLVKHHIESFDDFMDKKISEIIKQFNPLSIYNFFERNVYENEIRIEFGNVYFTTNDSLKNDGSY